MLPKPCGNGCNSVQWSASLLPRSGAGRPYWHRHLIVSRSFPAALRLPVSVLCGVALWTIMITILARDMIKMADCVPMEGEKANKINEDMNITVTER